MLGVGPGRPDALIDTEDGVVVTGAAAGARVVVRAEVELQGQSWTCTGEYVADGSGEVHTAWDPSVGGDYIGVDSFGLLWSADAAALYDWEPLAPMRVTLRATSESEAAESSYTRAWLAPGVAVSEVREHGVVGRLFRPTQATDAPAIVILAGSGGGLGGVPAAALLAGHGIAALALAHWRYPGTPDVLRDIDVEVVGAACDWLRRREGVADRRPTVLGISRGGELALLTGALMPDRVGTVVCDVGSGVPWGALGPGTDVNETAWRFRGEAVPQMLEDEVDPNLHLDDPDLVAAAEIPVECCSGRVLLVSGADDRLWPSARLSEIAVRRAERHGAADRVRHVCFPTPGTGAVRRPATRYRRSSRTPSTARSSPSAGPARAPGGPA